MSLTPRISLRTPLKFKYLTYKLGSGRTIFLPLINARLKSEKETLDTAGLLDTGATESFIPLELAEILEILPEREDKRMVTPVITAGGEAEFYRAKIEYIYLLKGGKIFYEFKKFTVLIPKTIDKDLPYVIFGRNSIFKVFNVTFMEKTHRFILEHHKWARKKGR